MPLSTSSVGRTSEPIAGEVDDRWLMAYAAGLGHDEPEYLDPTRSGGIAAHPLFPVCFEWPAMLAMGRGGGRDDGLAEGEIGKGVHASHDLVIHRPITAGTVHTTGSVAGVTSTRAGAYQMARLETVDDAGRPVCTTWSASMLIGVPTDGPDRPAPAPEPPAVTPPGPDSHRVTIPIGAGAAHVYTECARIWNPIHTDTRVANRAGLPGIILHGTATLAHAVSTIVRDVLGGDPTAVRRVGGRFRSMVLMPSTITVAVGRSVDGVVGFEVLTEAGEPAVRDGFLVHAPVAVPRPA